MKSKRISTAFKKTSSKLTFRCFLSLRRTNTIRQHSKTFFIIDRNAQKISKTNNFKWMNNANKYNNNSEQKRKWKQMQGKHWIINLSNIKSNFTFKLSPRSFVIWISSEKETTKNLLFIDNFYIIQRKHLLCWHDFYL